MYWNAILKGLGIGLLLMFAVGPVLFSIIKQSINHGKKGGFSFAIGVWFSDILWIILSNGFSALVADLLKFKTPIGIAGSGFLIGMGVYYLFLKKEVRREEKEAELAGDEFTAKGKQTNYFAILSSGFLLNTLNPAVITFWVVVTTSLASVFSFKERVIIFITCMIITMVADIGKVFGAGYLGKKLSDRNILRINRVSGALYLIFGVAIIIGLFWYMDN